MIVGVADDAKAAEKLNELYGVDAIVYQRFRITGVDHEAKQLPKGLDGYFLAITQRIASSPISQWSKDQIARDVRLINYYGRSLVVLRVAAGSEPCAFNGGYFERRGPNVMEVKQEQYTDLFKRFLRPG